jgi:hypothetical protein
MRAAPSSDSARIVDMRGSDFSFRGQHVAVMDSLPEIGDQACALYPEKLIYDIAGFPAVRGRELIAGLAERGGRYEPRYLLGEEAGRWPTTTASPSSRRRRD